MKKFRGLDAGWAQGTIVVLTDEFIVEELNFPDSEAFKKRWRAHLLGVDPIQCTTTVYFPRVPSITMMGRKGETRV